MSKTLITKDPTQTWWQNLTRCLGWHNYAVWNSANSDAYGFHAWNDAGAKRIGQRIARFESYTDRSYLSYYIRTWYLGQDGWPVNGEREIYNGDVD